ncbi:MAG: flagellar hook-associated protein FlgK [Nitrospirota bacterium]
MSVLGLFDIGKTALLTTRRALDTTAHNVANASTPGYTRQDVILENIPTGTITSVGMTGRGVRITEIKRMYDTFASLQVRTEKSSFSYWDAYEKGIVKIENVFNEASDTGISPAITDFFNAWQEVSQNPEGYAQRTLLIKKAEYLTSRISRAYSSLDDERTELYKSSQSLVAEVNSIAAKIADLNEKISTSPGALDLKDQRDYLIERLNEIVKVSTFEDNVGRYSILIGGAPLIDGGETYNMSVSTDTENNMHFYITLPGETKEITNDITSGELKANIDLRETDTPSIMNRLNAFALDLTLTMNEYHRSGYGLDNSTGNYFFSNISSPFTTKDSSTSGGSVTDANVTISNLHMVDFEKQYKIDYINETTWNALSQSEKDEYIKEEAGGVDIYWRIQESTDGKTWTTVNTAKINIDTTVANTRTLKFYGIDVKIDGTQANLLATSPTFETFTIRPYSNAAMNMGVAISDPNKVAAAAGDIAPTYLNTIVIDSSNNTIRFSEDNGGGYTNITLTAGTYTWSALAAELETQMEAAGGGFDYTVAYDSTNRRFIITNQIDGAGAPNPQTIIFDWTHQNTTAEDVFAFAANSSIAPAASDSSDFQVGAGYIQVNSSNNTIRFSEDNGATYVTATIPAGIYTRVRLAEVLKQALERADGATNYNYTVAFDAATNKYKILNNGTNPNPNQIIVNWTNLSTTAEDLFGFTPNSDSTIPVGGYAEGTNEIKGGSIVIDSSNNTIRFSEDGGTSYITVTLPKGTYTRNELALALKSAMESADASTSYAYTVTYNFNTKAYTITNNGGNPNSIVLDWAHTTTTSETVFGFISNSIITSGGGTDSSDFEVYPFLPGDNSNAKLIASLSLSGFIKGSTPSDYYRSIVTDVSVEASSAKISQKFHNTMVEELERKRQEASGVNLDEEAANLIKYQKSFEAAAKMISVADELLEALINMAGR